MTGWVVSTGTVTGVCRCCLCVPTVIRMWRGKEEMLFGNYTEVPPVVTEYLTKGLVSPGQDSFKQDDFRVLVRQERSGNVELKHRPHSAKKNHAKEQDKDLRDSQC